MFSPTPEALEIAELLLGKAGSDLAAARSLAVDPAQDDDVVGFHAQHAAEKALKAVVALRGVELPRSHDIALLVGLLEPHEPSLPEEVRQADWLNPWAVTMRYDEAGAALDREQAVQVAEGCLGWARECLDRARPASPPPAEA